jgi:hypothetical protein
VGRCRCQRNKYAKIDDEDYALVSQYQWYENEGYAITYRKDNTTGYPGVTVDPSTGYFRPNIQGWESGIARAVLDKHQAAVARDLWAVDMYGELASTNFPVVAFGP